MITKDLKTCKILISNAINNTLNHYSGTKEFSTYYWGFLTCDEDDFTVGSCKNTAFYHVDDVIAICNACNCQYYLCIVENLNGELTPAIHIF